MRRFQVRRSPRNPSEDVPGMDDFPWYVSEVTCGDDRDDYGRMESHAAAMELVQYMIDNPHAQCVHGHYCIHERTDA